MRRWSFLFIFPVLILLAGCREVGGGALSPIPTAQPTPVRPTRPAPSPTVPSPAEIPRIQARELWGRLQAGEAIVVVDVRSREEYGQEHIVGALSIPLNEVSRRLGELPKGPLIVFYCT